MAKRKFRPEEISSLLEEASSYVKEIAGQDWETGEMPLTTKSVMCQMAWAREFMQAGIQLIWDAETQFEDIIKAKEKRKNESADG